MLAGGTALSRDAAWPAAASGPEPTLPRAPADAAGTRYGRAHRGGSARAARGPALWGFFGRFLNQAVSAAGLLRTVRGRAARAAAAFLLRRLPSSFTASPGPRSPLAPPAALDLR